MKTTKLTAGHYFYLLLVLYALFFVLGSIAAPAFAKLGYAEIADNLYYLFSASCQQQPTRTFLIFSYPMAVCARCLGAYSGFISAMLWFIAKKPTLGANVFLILIVWVLLEKGLEWLIGFFPLPFLRFFFGIILGIALAVGLDCFVRYVKGKVIMKFLKRSTSILLMAGISAVLFTPTFAVQKNQPETWRSYLDKHQELTVEYRYPSQKIAANTINSDYNTGTHVKIPGGTPVNIKITETIDADHAVQGSSISFSVLGDVKINGKTVIKSGQLGQAQVVAAENRGRVGQEANIIISDFSVKAVDGTYIPLRGTISQKGKENVATSSLLSWLICPLFLLMKGGKATVPAGSEKTVYTGADTTVTVGE